MGTLLMAKLVYIIILNSKLDVCMRVICLCLKYVHSVVCVPFGQNARASRVLGFVRLMFVNVVVRVPFGLNVGAASRTINQDRRTIYCRHVFYEGLST